MRRDRLRLCPMLHVHLDPARPQPERDRRRALDAGQALGRPEPGETSAAIAEIAEGAVHLAAGELEARPRLAPRVILFSFVLHLA